VDCGLQAFCCFYGKISSGLKWWVAPNMEGLVIRTWSHHPSTIPDNAR
jgi:hypothetical protein